MCLDDKQYIMSLERPEIYDEITRIVRGLTRENVSKGWVYHKVIEEHPEFLESATQRALKWYVCKALKENGYKNISKGFNWFIRCGAS